jgi:hypothetical protein
VTTCKGRIDGMYVYDATLGITGVCWNALVVVFALLKAVHLQICIGLHYSMILPITVFELRHFESL